MTTLPTFAVGRIVLANYARVGVKCSLFRTRRVYVAGPTSIYGSSDYYLRIVSRSTLLSTIVLAL